MNLKNAAAHAARILSRLENRDVEKEYDLTDSQFQDMMYYLRRAGGLDSPPYIHPVRCDIQSGSENLDLLLWFDNGSILSIFMYVTPNQYSVRGKWVTVDRPHIWSAFWHHPGDSDECDFQPSGRCNSYEIGRHWDNQFHGASNQLIALRQLLRAETIWLGEPFVDDVAEALDKLRAAAGEEMSLAQYMERNKQ